MNVRYRRLARMVAGGLIAACTIFLLSVPVVGDSATKPIVLKNPGLQAGTAKPTGRYAVVIGINEYDSPDIASLRYSEKDAQDVADALIESCGYDKVTLLPGKIATRKNIILELDALIDRHQYKDPDTILFYFSGHGGFIESGSTVPNSVANADNYLVPVDGEVNEALVTMGNLPLQFVINQLAGSGFKRQIVMIDACRVQLSTSRGGSARGFDEDSLTPALRQAGGMKILFGSTFGKVSREDPDLQNGVFTKFLLQGLSGYADIGIGGDSNGVISFNELENYVTDQMVSYSELNKTSVQYPASSGEGSGVMPVAIVGSAPPQPLDMPEKPLVLTPAPVVEAPMNYGAPPKEYRVAVFEGPFRSSPSDEISYRSLRQAIYDLDGCKDLVDLNLLDAGGSAFPANIDCLVLIETFGMSEAYRAAVFDYLNHGGRILVMMNPMMSGGGDENTAYPSIPTIEDELETYGIRLNKQLIADQNCASIFLHNEEYIGETNYFLWPQLNASFPGSKYNYPANLDRPVANWSCPIVIAELKRLSYAELAKTSESSFLVGSPFNLDPIQDWSLLSSTSNKRGSFCVAAMAEGDFGYALERLNGSRDGMPLTENEGRLMLMTSALSFSDEYQYFSQNRDFLEYLMAILLQE